mmetsp:Transcript_38716/g.103823  ORF Transcript_38716/g.103823 Transcript_38716/m.103823 type:complete len:211 (-) Transcript_38716:373-1005(-)
MRQGGTGRRSHPRGLRQSSPQRPCGGSAPRGLVPLSPAPARAAKAGPPSPAGPVPRRTRRPPPGAGPPAAAASPWPAAALQPRPAWRPPDPAAPRGPADCSPCLRCACRFPCRPCRLAAAARPRKADRYLPLCCSGCWPPRCAAHAHPSEPALPPRRCPAGHARASRPGRARRRGRRGCAPAAALALPRKRSRKAPRTTPATAARLPPRR